MSTGIDSIQKLSEEIIKMLGQIETKIDAIKSEDFRKLESEVEKLKMYKISTEARYKARSGMILGILQNWGGFISIAIVIVMGVIGLKKLGQ